MSRTTFLAAHGAHPDWRQALDECLKALDNRAKESGTQLARTTLGFCYLTDRLAPHGAAILGELTRRLPEVCWVGTVGVGVCASGTEYFDVPALSMLVCDLPPEQFRLFSGLRPLPGEAADFIPNVALVHTDGRTPDLQDLLRELAGRMQSGYLFGGLAASRGEAFQFADGLLDGGLSGIAFAPEVALISRVTQGCQPVGPLRTITDAEQNFVLALDGEPALDCVLGDIGLDRHLPSGEMAESLAQCLVGVCRDDEDLSTTLGSFGPDTLVRHIVGIDPKQRVLAIAEYVQAGMQLALCRRDPDTALMDVERIAHEVREQLQASGQVALGAIYVSCSGRGGPHFGQPHAELAVLRAALGDLPLAGWFAGGEIARDRLYGYTGVLNVFAGNP